MSFIELNSQIIGEGPTRTLNEGKVGPFKLSLFVQFAQREDAANSKWAHIY